MVLNARNTYIQKCFDENQAFFKSNKFVLNYARDKTGRRVGVVIAYKDGSEVKVGWSKCNVSREDQFDKNIGIVKARDNAVDINTADLNLAKHNVSPRSMEDLIQHIVDRARKYFKV